MAKDYIRKRHTPRKSNLPRQFFIIIASFLLGYLTATIFDFTSLSTWLSKNVLKHDKPETPVKVIAKKASLPKPKFEFYTLLSKDSNVPATIHPASVAAAPPPKVTVAAVVPPPTTSSVTQVASQKAAAQIAKLGDSKPTTSASTTNKDTYLIQIASFPKRQDAEHVQANLMLKGFDVNIVAANQNNITWYRVIIGPFSNRHEAETVQLTVARNEHMNGMIRKLNS